MNQLRFLRVLLYKLKRQFGQSADIYRLNTSTVNRETGKKTIDKSKITVDKTIVMTSDSVRSFQYDKSYISAAKNFTYGAWFDADSRLFIFDSDDLPDDFRLLLDDFVIYNQQRYELKTVTIADHGYFTSAIGRAIEGGPVGQVHDCFASNILRLTQVTSGVLQ